MAYTDAGGIDGVLAGGLIGKTSFELHALLSARGAAVNRGIDDLVDDINHNEGMSLFAAGGVDAAPSRLAA